MKSAVSPYINMITLGVHNFKTSLDFYNIGLGFPRYDYWGDEEVAFFELTGTWLSIYPIQLLAADSGIKTTPFQPSFNGVTIYHNVKTPREVETTFQMARNAGAKQLKKPGQADWGGYSAYFSDPDGHVWGVIHNPFFWPGPV